MAIYHFSVKAISRGEGRSAVAAAAYRAGEKLQDDKYGKEQDYTKKSGVEFTNIYAPENTNPDLLNRQKLWNTVEKVERRKDALLAREFEIAFPEELNAEERKNLLNDLCQDLVKKHGVVVDAAIHAPHTGSGSDERNYHAHIMFTTRAISKTGDFESKKYRDFSRDSGTKTVSNWRENFADLTNRHLKQAGYDVQVDHRSYADQDNGLEATEHEGPAVTQLRRMGIATEISSENDAIKQRNAEKTVNEQAITGLEQEIIASEAILSDLQQEKAKSDAEHAQQEKIAAERKKERMTAQAIELAHDRATAFHAAFNPDQPNKQLVMQYIQDHALLSRYGKEPQPPAPVEQLQPTWWQRMTGQQPQQIEQPPFFEIEVIKATAQAIVEREQEQAQQQKWERLQEFLQHSPSDVDRIERDAIGRSFSKGIDAKDEELSEFIKYHRQHWREKEQAAKDWQAEYDQFMREEAAKANAEAEAKLQRERESEARLEAYRESKAQVDKEISEMSKKPVNNRDNEPKPRQKNDFDF